MSRARLHRRRSGIVASALVLLPALALSSCASTESSSSGAPSASDDALPVELTIVSYNIQHAQGADGMVDLERVAQVLEDSGAEVIGLQEVDRHFGARTEYVDQAAWLAQRLGMSYCYSANLDLDPEAGQTERRQYGTTILSAYPMDDCENTLLPNHPGGEQRGLAQADVRVRGVELRVFNTHLTHQSEQGRLDQAAVLNEKAASAGMPAVLVGDLNSQPDSAEYDVFTQVLSDAWPVVGDGPGYTFDSANPRERIDYALTSSEVTPIAAEVIATTTSDHMPLKTVVTLPHPSSNGDVHS
ncbi:endonuclease/exonuclease/phosphatase family protein [Microbacterium sp. SORGH_AS_0888]|uniref:endonuclease/exonuclease/phosphatase family protein n=1 Tax=Microbacterium sp. SORGH_AS_0888 TaxID=3041791 RepID=UPI002789B4C2|nr:endonuclease/exonuclease/phosphatase family protein [Microbacterium sp. SORGH_AS_0888]MDQ1128674.1 endonuclease/exonuclease/phosphatase family metal-dependent hydrolase [Microbacterium sp. SORGH_AS_0888]